MSFLPTEMSLVVFVELFDGIPRVRILGDQCSLLQERYLFRETIRLGKVCNLFEKLRLLNAMKRIS